MKQKKGYKDGIWFENWMDPIYSSKYWLIIVPQELSQAAPFLQKLTKRPYEPGKGAMAQVLEMTDPSGRQNIFIIVDEKCDYGTLLHEVIHAINASFKYHGVKLDTSNDEHQAYHTEWLFGDALSAFNRGMEFKQKMKENQEKKNDRRGRKKA